ncbi:hypothetical protein SODALDRAFT_363658 [Sodiomyces alkalinus F11]|uniref:Uncharacterized protein n=1 Tax=Sodiomyces alkalinus (strain CBS 110278 / VKM F-3762 / F11) TaxID=1314773 RepID=A0A3N2PKC3_SODAK|nr:hypothetical protein SODALDRAFT_363658 [Sodiomyces alkalinus F11]ROT34963.1 hypothetical protein SODALDRAFT_363658 [Sodiomyces alkalinus F11]
MDSSSHLWLVFSSPSSRFQVRVLLPCQVHVDVSLVHELNLVRTVGTSVRRSTRYLLTRQFPSQDLKLLALAYEVRHSRQGPPVQPTSNGRPDFVFEFVKAVIEARHTVWGYAFNAPRFSWLGLSGSFLTGWPAVWTPAGPLTASKFTEKVRRGMLLTGWKAATTGKGGRRS